MAIKKVYKCTMPSLNYVTRLGRNINFGPHQRYETDHPQEIEELEREVANKHPHILIDPHETEVDTTLQDRIREAQLNAAKEVLEAHSKEQEEQKQAGQKVGSQASSNASIAAPLQPVGMNAAQLLGVSNSVSLSAVSGLSTSGVAGAGGAKK